MATEEIQKQFFDYVDAHQKLYIDRLAEAVAIPSISAQLDEHLGDIQKMMEWTQAHIRRLGGECRLVDNPDATPERPLPPILQAEFVADPSYKTVCVYGHLDVQPAAKEDGWETDPFELVEKDGKLFGRGSTDDKGPALSWLWVVEAHQELGIPLPVNIKILYEGMEEYGSEGIFTMIAQEARPGKFLDNVDFFCISDNVRDCSCHRSSTAMMVTDRISRSFSTGLASPSHASRMDSVVSHTFRWKCSVASRICTRACWVAPSTRQ